MTPRLTLPLFLAFTTALGAQSECYEDTLSNPFTADAAITGGALAADGSTLVIGRTLELDDLGDSTGAAFVFERDTSGWGSVERLLASDRSVGAQFGHAVDIDGDTLVVGARFQESVGEIRGAAYVFERTELGWMETARLDAVDSTAFESFAFDVAISGDRIAVGRRFYDEPGATNAGAVTIFERNLGVWTATATLVGAPPTTDGWFGSYLDLEGDVLAVHAERQLFGGDEPVLETTVTIFRFDGLAWLLEQVYVPDDLSVELPSMRPTLGVDRLAIANPRDGTGRVDLFEFDGSVWTADGTVTGFASEDRFGAAVDLAGDFLAVGAPVMADGGQAFVYERITGTWTERNTFQYPPFVGELTRFGMGNQLAFAKGSHQLVMGTQTAEVASWSRPGLRSTYGAGTPGTNGIPSLYHEGCVGLDLPESMHISDGLELGTGLLFVSQTQAEIPFFGGTLLIGAPVFTTAPHVLDSDGNGFIPFAVNDGLVGLTFYCQAIYFDPVAPELISMTNGLRLEYQ